MSETESGTQGQSVPTNLRLLLVLEEVVRAGVPVTPTDANRQIGLPKPTIHRLFSTLEDEGFLQRDLDPRAYVPGQRLRQLATQTLATSHLATVRHAILSSVAGAIGETCNIAVPDRDAMMYLDRVETEWPLRIQLPVGTRVPLHCTASGKMYLSTWPEGQLTRFLGVAALGQMTSSTITDPDRLFTEIAVTRQRGYAEDAGEYLEGMIALAVPVCGADGRLHCTLSVHAPTLRLSLEEAQMHLAELRRGATELAGLLAA